MKFVNPQLIQEFHAPGRHFNFPKVELIIQNTRRILGDGIAFSEGNAWKRKRQVITAVFNYDFLTLNIPKIAKTFDIEAQRMEDEYFQSNPGAKTVKYYLLDLLTATFSGVMLKCFFGGTFKNEKINGEPLSVFLPKLIGDVSKQSIRPENFLLGPWFFNLGVTAGDRDINKRVKLLRQISKNYIYQRVEELKV